MKPETRNSILDAPRPPDTFPDSDGFSLCTAGLSASDFEFRTSFGFRVPAFARLRRGRSDFEFIHP
jgi:hypothetical protein